MNSTSTNLPGTTDPSPKPEAHGAPEAATGQAFWETLSDLFVQSFAFTEAQLSIWKIKLLQGFVMLILLLPLVVFATALLVYGFYLLDKSIDILLVSTQMATWFSPMVRGAVYFGIPGCILMRLWLSASNSRE